MFAQRIFVALEALLAFLKRRPCVARRCILALVGIFQTLLAINPAILALIVERPCLGTAMLETLVEPQASLGVDGVEHDMDMRVVLVVVGDEQGLVILDTPGLNAIGTEPELTLNMLPNAHAVLFILAADTGVTKSEIDVWRQYISGTRWKLTSVRENCGRM